MAQSKATLYDKVLGSDRERDSLIDRLKRAPLLDDEGRGLEVRVRRYKDTRTEEQNRLMWSMLGDLSKQRKWLVDGAMQYITDKDWKELLSAGLKKNQRVAQGLEGGFVVLGTSTHDMKIAEMTLLIEFAAYVGAQEPSGQAQVVWKLYPPASA